MTSPFRGDTPWFQGWAVVPRNHGMDHGGGRAVQWHHTLNPGVGLTVPPAAHPTLGAG